MRSCLTSLVVLAACSGTGFQLDVRVDEPTIGRVEVIIGAPCEQCPTEMAAPQLALRETTVYATAQPTAWYADVDGGTAGFVLETDSGVDELVPLLAVVGLDAGGKPVAIKAFRDVVIYAHGERSWRVLLEPIRAIDDQGQQLPDGTERAAVWRHPEQPEPSCVMLEDWSGGVATTRAIVPAGDPDCDRVANECAQNIPNAMVPPLLQNADCVVPAPVFSTNVCLLGGQPCVDGVPSASTGCQRIVDADYCVPSALCTSCAASTDGSCVFNALLSGTWNGALPQLYCNVPVTAGGELCAGPTKVSVTATTILPPGATCTNVNAVTNYFGGAMPSDTVDLGTMAKLVISNVRTPCDFDLTVSGSVPVASDTLELLGLEFASGRHIVIPFRVQSVANCNETFGCSFSKGTNTTESVFTCARAM